MPKSPTELSLREILDRYSSDKELLKVILEAKCLEDKKIAAQETHMEERVKLENRKIEYEIMRQFKNHPLVQPPKVLFSDPNAKQNQNNNGQQQRGLSGASGQLPTLSSYLPTSAGTQISPSSQQFTPITPFNQHEGSNPDSPPHHPRILSDVTIPGGQKYSPTHNNNSTNNNSGRPQRPRINTNTFPYSRPEAGSVGGGGAPLTLSIYRTANTNQQHPTSQSIKTISGMVHRHSRNDPIKSAPVRDRRDHTNLESSSLESGV